MNILLIEDDEDTAVALEMLLRQAGMQTYWARDGKQAVLMLEIGQRARGAGPDALVLDLRLPDLTPGQVVAKIADLGPLPAIVIYSAAPEREMAEVARSIGATAAIRKPADAEVLVQAIENAVRDSSARLRHA